jgi:branched-chain amino acid transport system substrate-binding protein
LTESRLRTGSTDCARKKVEIIFVDNKSDKVEAANAVKRLVEKEKVNAIIGTYGSSLAMAGGEVAEKARIPMVDPHAPTPSFPGKKNVFRVCFIDPFQGAAQLPLPRKS